MKYIENRLAELEKAKENVTNKHYKVKEETLPSWFDKKIENKEMSKEEEAELDNLLKEFS